MSQLRWHDEAGTAQLEHHQDGVWEQRNVKEQEFGKSHIAGMERTTTLGYPSM